VVSFLFKRSSHQSSFDTILWKGGEATTGHYGEEELRWNGGGMVGCLFFSLVQPGFGVVVGLN